MRREIQAAVRDHVAHARAELRREAKKSKLLNGLNPISFLAGALGGTIAGSTGGTAGMTAGAVGGTIGPLVQAILNSRKTPGYLERHYLVFEPITVSH
jgi:fructose-specific phosphotransferase system IIC component